MSVKELKESEFEEKVLKSKGVTIIDCYATWCGPCKMLSPIIDEIAEELTDYSFYKLDVDGAPSISQNYEIMSIPTILVFVDGNLKNESVGFKSKESLISFIKESIK